MKAAEIFFVLLTVRAGSLPADLACARCRVSKGEVAVLEDLALIWTAFLHGSDSSPLPGEEQGSSSLSVSCSLSLMELASGLKWVLPSRKGLYLLMGRTVQPTEATACTGRPWGEAGGGGCPSGWDAAPGQAPHQGIFPGLGQIP